MSGLVNKVKEALHSDKHNELPEGTHGTHNSRMANAADPRFDSDRDHRANPATSGTHHAPHNAPHNTSHNATTGYNDPTGTHGTHNSHMANAADPRIDSDRDHRGAPGSGMTGGSAGHAPFNSNTHTGYNDPMGTHGTHNSRMANAADPRIDSDRDHRGAPGAAGTSHFGSGPGPAHNTAGPHSNDMMNKADPRVDSDMDGSKTFGGNKTYHSGASRDPTDAAQVPPSVLREHVGGPTIEHGDVSHGREQRHQSISHQESHRGV